MSGANLLRTSLRALEEVGQGYAREPAAASSGLDFSSGEFQVSVPEDVSSLLRASISEHQVSNYGSPRGWMPLRDLAKSEVDPRGHFEDVLITAGGKEAFWLAAQLAVEDDCRIGRHSTPVVLVPKPGWQPYSVIMTALGATIEYYDPIDVFDIKPSSFVSRHRKASIAILNYPHNPTGFSPTQVQLNRVVSCLRELRCRIISDEVYRVFGSGATVAAAPLSTQADFLFESASKWLAAAGLRVGFLFGARASLDRAAAFRSTYASGTSAPSQQLALALMSEVVCRAWLRRLAAELEHNREGLQVELQRVGFDITSAGGLYLWARPGQVVDTAEGAIGSVVRGSTFGSPDHIRICCAREGLNLPEAAASIARGYRRLQAR